MRLIRIRPTYFRGFGASGWINLDADFVLVFGPNGFGKTSLAEAIEWIIYGKTRRREKGNTFSRLEYRGSYRNVHAPDGAATSVCAVVRIADGTEHAIERTLRPSQQRSDEDSELLVDGSVASFASLGLEVNEAFYPIIVQHGLQDFIHARPIDRRDAISAAFGLEPLIQFKGALEQARNSFRNAPPTVVLGARDRLRDGLIRTTGVDCLVELATRWRQHEFALNADYEELLELAQQELDDDAVAPEDVADRLEQRKVELQAAVFDLDAIRPSERQEDLLRQLDSDREETADALRTLGTTTEAFLEQSASVYTDELLRFWEQGLSLVADRNNDMCPMCESETLPATKRDELRSRIENNQQYRDARRALLSAVSRATETAQALSLAVSALTHPHMSNDQKERLRNLFADDQTVVQPLIEAADLCTRSKDTATRNFSRMINSLGRVAERVEHSRARQHVSRSIVAMRTRVDSSARGILDAWRAYAPVVRAVEDTIIARISSDASIRTVDALLQLWSAKAHVKVLAAFNGLLAETLGDMQAVERFIQVKHTELFESRGAEIQSWYDEMCPGADVRYTGMEAVTDTIKLYAESFGQRMPAAPCLSHSQLNCLGLGVYITCGTTPNSPFGFLVFDDPVQSMDDDHCESFMERVIGRLLDEAGEQVIVLSHLEPVTNRLHRLHNHHRLLKYKIDQFRRTGPSIVTYEPLETEIREIQVMADGNEENRKLAVQKLRPTIERIVRELHVKETGQPLDHSLARATAADLLRAFTQIPNTVPQEHQRFRDTVGFADPSHHTEDGWQVPTKPQILTHVDRLRQLARQKGLIE